MTKRITDSQIRLILEMVKILNIKDLDFNDWSQEHASKWISINIVLYEKKKGLL